MVKRVRNSLSLRIISALVLGALALLIIWQGVRATQVMIFAGALGALVEWSLLCFRVSKAPIKLERYWGGGVIYIVIAGIGLVMMAGRDPHYSWRFVQILTLVIASDVGAFFIGRLIGGPKLAPHISPNKTWSGALGGFCSGIFIVTVFSIFFRLEPISAPWLVCYAIVAQIGDLVESWMKRRFEVKDSGAIIPGHGGILDRFDSILAVGIAYFIKIILFQR